MRGRGRTIRRATDEELSADIDLAREAEAQEAARAAGDLSTL
jgi:hypothetical protein